jgi:Replication-relaxation
MLAVQPTQTATHPAPRLVFPRHESEERILESFLFYRYLSVEQVCRLHFSSGALKHVYAKLADMAERGLLWTVKHRRKFAGHSLYVYTPSYAAIRYLAEQGYEVPERYHRTEIEGASYAYLDHTLAVNDFFIGLELLERETAYLQVQERLHELELKKRATKVQITPDGDRTLVTATVIPDGWADVVAGVPGNGYRRSVALELDRGTHKSRRFKEKIAARLAWSRGPYQRTFGSPIIVVAIVATPGAPRAAQLLTWTQDELTRLHATPAECEQFIFTALPPDSTPEQLFFDDCWRLPFQTQPTSLLRRLAV